MPDSIEHPDDERHQHEHQHAADPVQDGDDARRRQPVGGQVGERIDIAELAAPGPGRGNLCHGDFLCFFEETGCSLAEMQTTQNSIATHHESRVADAQGCFANAGLLFNR
jgi:hypothetical protein